MTAATPGPPPRDHHDGQAAAWEAWYAADSAGRTMAQDFSESKYDAMRRAFLAAIAAQQPRDAYAVRRSVLTLAASYARATEDDEIEGHTPGSLYTALRAEVLHGVGAELRKVLDAAAQQPAPELAADMAALAKVAEGHERVMYAALIDITHGDPNDALELLNEQLDGFDGPQWNGTETGLEWLERTHDGPEPS